MPRVIPTTGSGCTNDGNTARPLKSHPMQAPMKSPRRVLVVQTAFLGDVVLTLPLVQVIHRTYPETEISFLATPRGAEALHNHPAIHSVVVYDKRGAQRGIRPLLRLVRWLKSQEFDVALVPHRSFRSALLVWLTGIPVRIGFDTSAGAFMFTRTVPYVRSAHEVSRNFAFLTPLEIGAPPRELPELYPSSSDVKAVDEFLKEFKVGDRGKIIALSPGSAWNTKRWPSGRFAELAKRLRHRVRHDDATTSPVGVTKTPLHSPIARWNPR